ncbi:prolyl oligopeptidase family serine peptidase [Mobiluncus mulieris]|uniref:prolyl oligopeptidase family serine peptidase n=1 Tax=Mobiluncus mulieris TaxID=2052 RepID=UPI00146FD4CE|nr:prolyl oligopeptidase family serine peptidase [Mobiluncus mulieris]NMX02170.1 S9 family peptidase [Mobiluncus mulieris]NMX20656.1 S9 family peptidase [Mobiluncus mulieris]
MIVHQADSSGGPAHLAKTTRIPRDKKGSSDPYRFLEQFTSRTQQWVAERCARTTATLSGDIFDTNNSLALEALETREHLGSFAKRGSYIYDFHSDVAHPYGLWRRTPFVQFMRGLDDVRWEVLLDIDQLNDIENRSWTFGGAELRYPDFQRALITLHPGGSDIKEIREFDLREKRFVPPDEGGFAMSGSKGTLTWAGPDSVIITAYSNTHSLTTSGYPRTVRLWHRAEPVSTARLLLVGDTNDIMVGARFDPTPGYEHLIGYRVTDFNSTLVYELDIPPQDFHSDAVGPVGAFSKKFRTPASAKLQSFFGWILLRLRQSWHLSDTTYRAGSLLAIPYESAFSDIKPEDISILFEPKPRCTLLDVAAIKTGVTCTYVENVETKIQFSYLEPTDEAWKTTVFSNVGSNVNRVKVRPVDSRDSAEVWVSQDGFLTPPTLLLGTPDYIGLNLELVQETVSAFDTSHLEVEQRWAKSKDGTSVPYFLVAPKETLRKRNPTRTLLVAYGGFGELSLPTYSPVLGKLWLEHGGCYAVANIRGGGELGPQWHHAARREGRHRSYEDFAAVAQALISDNVTAANLLGAYGLSNGGLLIGNMYTTYPQLFGALICDRPILDLENYTSWSAGSSWISEYGDPATDDWAYLSTYSPYHNVTAQPSPPILILTASGDDRVHPAHARKFQAVLEQAKLSSLFFESSTGGHAGPSNATAQATHYALMFTFLDLTLR